MSVLVEVRGPDRAAVYYGTILVASIKSYDVSLSEMELHKKAQSRLNSGNVRRRHCRAKFKCVGTSRLVPKAATAYRVQIHKNAFHSKSLHQRYDNSFSSMDAAVKAAQELRPH